MKATMSVQAISTAMYGRMPMTTDSTGMSAIFEETKRFTPSGG